jgi:hypothetical protein
LETNPTEEAEVNDDLPTTQRTPPKKRKNAQKSTTDAETIPAEKAGDEVEVPKAKRKKTRHREDAS